MKKIRYILLFLVLLSFISCNKSNDIDKVKTVVKDGILKVIDKDKSYILADDALDYNVIYSSQYLIVETRVFSNLQTIRVYKKNGIFKQINPPVAQVLWNRVCKKNRINIEDIRYPQMSFIKWINKNKILVNLTGEIGDKKIDENITYDLTTNRLN